MPKLKVVVLSGGPSAEHEVSLKSGQMAAAKLNKRKYDVKEVVIDKNGKWSTPVKKIRADVVFVAMHGEYGEDGTVQQILKDTSLVYTGSGPEASRLAMDKVKSSHLFEHFGLLVPPFISVHRQESSALLTTALNNWPIVVKPADRGSSVGVSIVNQTEQLKMALENSFQYSPAAVLQKFISGREVTCGVLDDGLGNITPLVPTEIIPYSDERVRITEECAIRIPFFDYQAKYTPGGSREITPPDLPAEVIKEIQTAAVKAHKILDCSGMSRTDFILALSHISHSPAGEAGHTPHIFILETNTIPGLTETSLLPQGAAAMGISFPQLLDRIITAALNQKSPHSIL